MLAEQNLRDGDLGAALANLENAIRDDPANAKNRVFLFQLFCLLGKWDRALNQLAVLQDLDAEMLALVFVYRDAIQSEAFRSDVFAARRKPLIFGEPTPWIAFLLESLKAVNQQRQAEAAELRDQALAMAATVGGSITNAGGEPLPFSWIADADSRLGPILEVILEGKYFWVPFEHIASIQMEEPEDLRDLVWAPAQFRWTNGGEAMGLIPTRYAGSELAEDSQIRMSGKTDWMQPTDGVCYGLGQRMLATDNDDHPLLQIRRIDLAPTS